MTIFLTAPLDLHEEMSYEIALAMLGERYGIEQISADRALFSSADEYNETWLAVYSPENADGLYILCREDGTINSRVYQQWRWLSETHGVPATLLLLDIGSDNEVRDFAVSLLEESERDDKYFALVNPRLPGFSFGELKTKAVVESRKRFSWLPWR